MNATQPKPQHAIGTIHVRSSTHLRLLDVLKLFYTHHIRVYSARDLQHTIVYVCTVYYEAVSSVDRFFLADFTHTVIPVNLIKQLLVPYSILFEVLKWYLLSSSRFCRVKQYCKYNSPQSTKPRVLLYHQNNLLVVSNAVARS